jgi:hypothetical protein
LAFRWRAAFEERSFVNDEAQAEQNRHSGHEREEVKNASRRLRVVLDLGDEIRGSDVNEVPCREGEKNPRVDSSREDPCDDAADLRSRTKESPPRGVFFSISSGG